MISCETPGYSPPDDPDLTEYTHTIFEVIELVKDTYLKDISHDILKKNLKQLYTPLHTPAEASQLIELIKNGKE